MFTRGIIQEGITPRSPLATVTPETIRRIVLDAGIDSPIGRIGEPTNWNMHVQYVWLDDGRRLLLKISTTDWVDAGAILNYTKSIELVRSLGIPQPRTLHYSESGDGYGFRFVLSEGQDGMRFCDAYQQASRHDRPRLLAALGRAYSRLHGIKNNWAGLWDGDPSRRKFPIHPAEFYNGAEIHDGSARYLLEHNLIDTGLLEAIGSVWDEDLPYLKQRPSSLTHISPFPWCIYLHHSEGEYAVSGFTSVGDFMWWDSMTDIAHLLYPPFLNINGEERAAFISAYGLPLDDHAIRLYRLLHRLCAMAGCYLAPVDKEHANEWVRQEVVTLREIVDELAR